MDSTQRACREFVHSLGLPRVDSIGSLIPVVERRTGCRIRVEEAPRECDTDVCGLWIRAHDVDHVFVHRDTSRAHQDHIIAHELAHILCEHRPPEAGGITLPTTITERLMPSLDPELIRMILGRTNYEYQDEREAELIASHLQHRIHRPAPPEVDPADRVAHTLLRQRG
ncbi:hypothetical protein DVA86_27780 [Streptomyces armeniacus]|uniref:ImmA/IrrE family metallo-endopeptidase n=1 Tax=Streptomyces armeniacus TaxID=83291 RepID=A0A345XW42_9ACTN|nr:hypothetical protein [Streptomyces armeniacus]AXK35858.1 hypothetical protein DVA86_27780 [Streptomyces armeniacus]